jgi:hypothetical protein
MGQIRVPASLKPFTGLRLWFLFITHNPAWLRFYGVVSLSLPTLPSLFFPILWKDQEAVTVSWPWLDLTPRTTLDPLNIQNQHQTSCQRRQPTAGLKASRLLLRRALLPQCLACSPAFLFIHSFSPPATIGQTRTSRPPTAQSKLDSISARAAEEGPKTPSYAWSEQTTLTNGSQASRCVCLLWGLSFLPCRTRKDPKNTNTHLNKLTDMNPGAMRR